LIDRTLGADETALGDRGVRLRSTKNAAAARSITPRRT